MAVEGERPIDGVPGLVVGRLLGEGGFGEVFLAEEVGLGREVAVKVLSIRPDADVLRRFARESEVLGSLSQHPNIVTLYRHGVTERGFPYLVMEYAPGGSLGDRMRLHGPFEWEEAFRIGAGVCAALSQAHAQGIFHLDVKPDNIFISRFGVPLLGDFGIATLVDSTKSQSRTFTATLAHASPEQLSGVELDGRSDLYSLASTLFQLVDGHPAFIRPGERQDVMAIIGRVATTEVPDLDGEIPEAAARIVTTTMSKERDDRPADADTLRSALMSALSEPLPDPAAVTEAVEPDDSPHENDLGASSGPDEPATANAELPNDCAASSRVDDADSGGDARSGGKGVAERTIHQPIDLTSRTESTDTPVVASTADERSADAAAPSTKRFVPSAVQEPDPQPSPGPGRSRLPLVIGLAGAAALIALVAALTQRGSPPPEIGEEIPVATTRPTSQTTPNPIPTTATTEPESAADDESIADSASDAEGTQRLDEATEVPEPTTTPPPTRPDPVIVDSVELPGRLTHFERGDVLAAFDRLWVMGQRDGLVVTYVAEPDRPEAFTELTLGGADDAFATSEHVWLPNFDGSTQGFRIVDPTSLQLLTRVSTPDRFVRPVWFGDMVVFPDESASQLRLVDSRDGAPVGSIVLSGDEPNRVTRAGDGFAWVANSGSDTISIVDIAAREEIDSIELGDLEQWFMSPGSDGASMIVKSANDVVVIVDIESRREIQRFVNVGSSLRDVAAGHYYAVDRDTVLVVNLSTGQEVYRGTLSTGPGISRSMHVVGDEVWVAGSSSLNDNVDTLVFDTRDPSQPVTLELPPRSVNESSIVVDGLIWTASGGSGASLIAVDPNP